MQRREFVWVVVRDIIAPNGQMLGRSLISAHQNEDVARGIAGCKCAEHLAGHPGMTYVAFNNGYQLTDQDGRLWWSWFRVPFDRGYHVRGDRDGTAGTGDSIPSDSSNPR